jgi:hypothetical protein
MGVLQDASPPAALAQVIAASSDGGRSRTGAHSENPRAAFDPGVF